MRDSDYSIEERDDPRTWANELIPDCEKEIQSAEETELPIIEYLAEFKALIDACGQASYFFNMKKFVAAEVNKAKVVAQAYGHDLRYYEDQLKEWRVKGERSYAVLTHLARRFDYDMPEEKAFLNSLALYSDRRKAYKGYLQTCLKNRKTLSPKKLEAKYQKRLEKRLKKKPPRA